MDYYSYFTQATGGQSLSAITSLGGLAQSHTLDTLGSTASAGDKAGGSNFGADFGMGMQIGGAIGGMVGSYITSRAAAKAEKMMMEVQARAQKLNSRMALHQAELSDMETGRQVGHVSFAWGQRKAATQAAMAANGIAVGVGNSAEVLASQDLAYQSQRQQILLNGLARTWGYRIKATGAVGQAQSTGAAADSISPTAAAFSGAYAAAGTAAKKMTPSFWGRAYDRASEYFDGLGD